MSNNIINVKTSVNNITARIVSAINIKATFSAPQGLSGPPGSQWHDGEGVPSNGLGSNNDYYLNTLNGDVYKKTSGTYTLVGNIKGDDGTSGTSGTDGATWRDGSGAPANGLGVDGDYYFDILTADVYKKATGTYSIIANIKGAPGDDGADGANGLDGDDGTDGATWNSGVGAPSNGLGNNGDFYLDTATSDVYKKTAGTYSIILNIKGADGTGSGDMEKTMYDPQNIEDDAFDRANHTGVQTIATITDLQTELDSKVDKNAPITGATKTKITYNADGLVTAGTDLLDSDIPTLTASKISDFDTEVSNNVDVADSFKKSTDDLDDILPGTTNKHFTQTEKTKLAGIESGATADQIASEVPVTPTGNLAANDVQEALEELQTDINSINSSLGGLTDVVVLKGTWDASAGSFPGAGVAQAGWSYIVSVAGTVDGASFNVNDRLLSTVDNASATTFASNWHKLDYTDQVLSVNGQTGAVTLNQDQIGDGTTNKQYSATEKTKLAGIEDSADVTDAGNVGSSIHGSSGKTTPVDVDTMPVIDSAASNVLKKVTWANIKATLKTYFDTLYATVTHTHAASDITDFDTEVSNNTDVAANTAARHTRSHAISSVSDHTAGNWKVFYSNGSGQLIELALGASGEVLKSNGASSAPSFQTDNAGGGGGITWNEVVGTSQTAAVNNGYIANNASLVTITLPDTAAVGDTVRVAGKGAGKWKIAQNASEIIHFGIFDTTTGTGGSIQAEHKYDTVELLCIVANTEWLVISSFGNIDYT